MGLKDFSDTELYEVKWRPNPHGHKDRPASRENSVQKATDSEKPRKILNLQMSSFGQEMKKEEKKFSKGRYLNPNERFEPQFDDKMFKND